MGLSPQEMEEAIIKNLPEKTGKSLEEWHKVLTETSLSEPKELKAHLKDNYGVGHFQAQTVVKHFIN